MPLNGSPHSAQPSNKRPPPFSIRLTDAERADLVRRSRGAPLSAFIKSRLFDDQPLRARRSASTVEDREALARALALLGQSRISSNLNQLARAAHMGVLPLTPETESELRETLAAVRQVRDLLMSGLGLRKGGKP